MAKEKIDLIINGITFKGIQVANWSGKYNIDTAGISQIIRQYIKFKYGDIKNWVRSKSFAGGSSVDVYLWNVPEEWYKDIRDFSDSFGIYNEYDGGDGYWRGKSIGATTTDGKIVGNYSPYMHVHNSPPWDAKEKEMPPPNYSDSKKRATKKSFSKGSFKKESKTEGFEFLQSCMNGWKLFFKENEGSPKPYQYRLIKDYDVKPVDKDKFYSLKGDMLEVGFSWSVKAQCFEMFKFDEITQDEVDSACEVLFNYFPFKKESNEIPKEKENIPEEKESNSIPSDDKGSESIEKVPIESIYLVWDDKRFDSFGEFENYIKNILYEGDESNIPTEGYDKYKVEFKWKDGSYIVDRIDISKNKGDFNPFKQTISDYYETQISDGVLIVMYDQNIKGSFTELSFSDFKENEDTQNEQVDLEQHLNDVSILLEMETDSEKELN